MLLERDTGGPQHSNPLRECESHKNITAG
jgi:hypothetical protein